MSRSIEFYRRRFPEAVVKPIPGDRYRITWPDGASVLIVPSNKCMDGLPFDFKPSGFAAHRRAR